MREIALAFLKIGVTAYGGLAAIWGVMQADLQEKRGWLSKERFLEGLALVTMLPGAVDPPNVRHYAHCLACAGAPLLEKLATPR